MSNANPMAASDRISQCVSVSLTGGGTEAGDEDEDTSDSGRGCSPLAASPRREATSGRRDHWSLAGLSVGLSLGGAGRSSQLPSILPPGLTVQTSGLRPLFLGPLTSYWYILPQGSLRSSALMKGLSPLVSWSRDAGYSPLSSLYACTDCSITWALMRATCSLAPASCLNGPTSPSTFMTASSLLIRSISLLKLWPSSWSFALKASSSFFCSSLLSLLRSFAVFSTSANSFSSSGLAFSASALSLI